MNIQKKKLSLHSETLVHLTPDQIGGVVGGTSFTMPPTLPGEWWNHTGGKQFVSRALCTTHHCPISGGTLTSKC